MGMTREQKNIELDNVYRCLELAEEKAGIEYPAIAELTEAIERLMKILQVDNRDIKK